MDSRKPLTAGEIARDTVYVERVTNGKECGENCPCSYVNREDELSCILDGKELAYTWEPKRGLVSFRAPKCLSLLTPPPDAAVREAVELVDKGTSRRHNSDFVGFQVGILRAILRAVQSPRPSSEQHRVVRIAVINADLRGDTEESEALRAAFPELVGEVGRG